jgi:hypothetical protein
MAIDKQDYAMQWFKLAGKCFVWVAGIAFLLGAVFSMFSTTGSSVLPVAVVAAGYACLYAAIPIALFSTFIVTLRAFETRDSTTGPTAETADTEDMEDTEEEECMEFDFTDPRGQRKTQDGTDSMSTKTVMRLPVVLGGRHPMTKCLNTASRSREFFTVLSNIR